MKVLVVGGGGREHAFAWKIAQSPQVELVYVAPGNAGTASESGVENISISANDINSLLKFSLDEQIDLTVVGPEEPLVLGICDRFAEKNLKCFGPSKAAAQLEGSKTFTKEFLVKHAIPTAAYESFTEQDQAINYFDSLELPSVIKADGLAAGKGVIIAQTRKDGVDAITDMLSGNRFGEAGHRVVIEEFLQGEEASFICMVDGKNILPLASSQDHKAAHNGDTGPNTGGMGAYSPAPIVDDIMHSKIMDQIMRPTVNGLIAEGIPYTGFLYAGVMIDTLGEPRVLEYNCRFGDPETQPIMMRLQTDLVNLCMASIEGTLDRQEINWDPRPSLGVVIASRGYPDDYESGHEIGGLDCEIDNDVKIFHAGTKMVNNCVVTSGGRVLCATALGDNLADAQQRAYDLGSNISWSGSWCRNDIGYRGIERIADSK